MSANVLLKLYKAILAPFHQTLEVRHHLTPSSNALFQSTVPFYDGHTFLVNNTRWNTGSFKKSNSAV